MPRLERKFKSILQRPVSNDESKPKNVKESSATSSSTVYSVSGHSSNTMDLLKRDKKHCDAVIEAGGEKFIIHKSVLAIYSDYFDKVFTVEMQEKYNNEVKLEDTRSDVMKCIVDFIYTGQLSINRENAIELLKVADYLHIEKIKEFSVKFLLSNLDSENCISVWIYAKIYDITDLREKSEAIFGTNLLSVAREELEWLSSEQFLEIMRSTNETRKNAEESFCITADWTNRALGTRQEVFGKLFQSFDLSLFSKSFLSDVARSEPLITKSPESAHHVIAELLARLDEATEREEKINQRIAKIEEDKQASGEKTDWLVEENKRLTQQAWESNEQAEHRTKLAKKKIESLVKANKELVDRLQFYEHKAQQVSLKQKTSARKTSNLVRKNKRLTQQLQNSSRVTQRAEAHQTNLARRQERLFEENRTLTEEIENKLSIVHQAELHQKALEEKVDFLSSENERLNEQLEDYAGDLEQAEDEKQELDIIIGEHKKEKERLSSRIDVEISKAFQARSTSLSLQKQVEYYMEENQRNSEAVEMWYDRYSESNVRYGEVVAIAQDAEHNISRLINDASKSSWIWNGIYLSFEDKRQIKAQLSQIDFEN